jgi:hypothetical protein
MARNPNPNPNPNFDRDTDADADAEKATTEMRAVISDPVFVGGASGMVIQGQKP